MSVCRHRIRCDSCAGSCAVVALDGCFLFNIFKERRGRLSVSLVQILTATCRRVNCTIQKKSEKQKTPVLCGVLWELFLEKIPRLHLQSQLFRQLNLDFCPSAVVPSCRRGNRFASIFHHHRNVGAHVIQPCRAISQNDLGWICDSVAFRAQDFRNTVEFVVSGHGAGEIDVHFTIPF